MNRALHPRIIRPIGGMSVRGIDRKT